MSQNSTTPSTDENRAPATIPTPLFVPMMPMFFPYGNTNTAGQQYFAPAVYSNVSAYSSTGNHHHGNYGISYNTFYGPFYPTPNNILTSATHITNSATLIPPRPLMGPSLFSLPQQTQQQSSGGSSLSSNGTDNERNKNLNIRECQSPVANQTKKEKKSLQIVDPNDINIDLRIREDSSSTSSVMSRSESDQIALPLPAPSSSSFIQEIDSDNPQDDFLTFIEQKTKTTTTTTTMPELNPFADEFSFVNNKTLTKESSITTNGIDHHTDNDNQSSYRLLFDNLIEKSLESIEAIKKSSKKVSVNDMSVQCNQINESINRSTQTIEHLNNDNQDFIEEYSSRAIKLMDKLLENFRNIYQNELHNQYTTMAHTCDELRHLILFIHHIISTSSSSNNEQRKKSSIDLDNPFSNMLQELANDTTNINRYPSSQLTHTAGRGRLMTTTNNSILPSFSCRQIDSISTITPKLCLLCQRPVEDNDDVMHKLCRSLSSRPNMSTDR